MLDSGPLGQLAHFNAPPAITAWLRSLLAAKYEVIVPEISDYEIRRSLILHNRGKSLTVLDALKSSLSYQPITTTVMLRAAELWADARQRGTPTADPKELDADVILAAMALEAGATVATENLGHLSRYVTASHWKAIVP
ncbi:MAG TPA: PIN domain-containing protein [Tepidisphaeraceae bacterium]|nr:PIN domain-containing protein [Tepidisphaeraceae bacterium]